MPDDRLWEPAALSFHRGALWVRKESALLAICICARTEDDFAGCWRVLLAP